MKVAKENSRGRFETLFAAVLIVMATWLAYGPSFSGVFLFDDEPSILKNEQLHRVSPIWRILVPPSHLATLAGRPILNLSLVLNWAWGRDSVFGYHVVNFLIHAVAGVLLWEIVRRLLRLPGTDERLRSSGWWLTTVVALIWTLHPLQTESVTYIVQRAECMAGMFYFASILAFIVGTESEAGLRRYLYPGSVIACLLAIGTKESGATIPVTILFLDRAFFSTGWKECLRRGGGAFYIALFSCWGVLALLMFSSGQRGGSAGFGLGMTSLEYALSQFGIISRYLRLTFYPHPLALDYGMWLAKTPGEIWPYAVLIVLLVVGTFWLWIRQPRWGFAAFFFWFTLGPTSSVVPLVTQTAAEHRMYLPLGGLIPFVVLGFTWLWSRMMENLRRKGWDIGPLAGFRVFLAVSIIGSLGWMSYERNILYQDPIAIWKSNTKAWPQNPRAHSTLAWKLFESCKYSEALEACDATLEIFEFPGIHFLKGEIFKELGQTDQMMASYSDEIRFHPDHAPSYHNRGVARSLQGDLKGAEEDLIEATRLRPYYATYFVNLGKVQQQLTKNDQALKNYSECLRINPRQAEVYLLRGALYEQIGQLSEAESDLSSALELDPGSLPGYFSRGLLRRKQKNYRGAIDDFSQIIGVNSQVGEAYEERAKTYLEMGEIERARADASACQRLGMKLDEELLKKLML